MTDSTQTGSDNDVTRKHSLTEVGADKIKDTQELDVILFELANYAHGIGTASGYGVFVGGEPQKKAKQAIKQLIADEMRELLDRIDRENNRCNDGCWVTTRDERTKLAEWLGEEVK